MLRPALLVVALVTGAWAQSITTGAPDGPLCNVSVAPLAKRFDEAMTKLIGSPDALSVSEITGLATESDDRTTAVCSGTLVKDLPRLCPKLFLLARHRPGGGPSSYPAIDEVPSQLRWMVQVLGDGKGAGVSIWNAYYRHWDHWFDVRF